MVGESAGTVKLLNKFVKIYRFTHTVNIRIYACTGYFMISTTAEELVAAMQA